MDEKAKESRGLFGLEDEVDYDARKFKLERLQEKIARLDRGYEGTVRVCPQCTRKSQYYKGDCARRIRLDCGVLSVKRAYYVCCECEESSYPLDDRLGLVKGQEQGRLREKMALLAVLMPYNQAPYICEVLLSTKVHAENLRRLLARESGGYQGANAAGETTLQVSAEDTVYLEIDGHMCPTREARKEATDQGYREAKIVMAFCDTEIAAVSKDRKALLQPLFQGRIAPAAEFVADVQAVYNRANATHAKRVVALADGAKWIWKTIEEVAPEAIQILDYAHAKGYLSDAAKIIYGPGSPLIAPWIAQQQDLLFADNAEQVIANIHAHLGHKTQLAEILTYLENNKSRMQYGAYQRQGLLIGSGAIESAGKRIAQGRIKGGGMRWNISQANRLIQLRCAFFDGSWKHYWSTQRKLAA